MTRHGIKVGTGPRDLEPSSKFKSGYWEPLKFRSGTQDPLQSLKVGPLTFL